MGDKEEENLGSYYMSRGATPPQQEPPKRKLPQGTLTVIAILAFISIVWYAYPRSGDRYVDMDVPVVKADATPVKVAPVDPGGMEVPHQDSTAFAPLEKNPDNGPEKILPRPEEAMDKTAAIGATDDTPAPEKTADAPAAEVGDVAAIPPQDASAAKLDLAPQATPETPAPKAKKAEKLVPPAATVAEKTAPAKAASTAAASYIQLGSYRDIAGAKKDWEWARKKFPGFLKDLSMRTEKVVIPAKGTFYRLQAGKVTESRARDICATLKTAVPGGCILVKGQK